MAEYPRFAERFELINQLAVGGMGEIFLAREEREDGARMVVVKRILQTYAGDDHFVQMFLDEARLAAKLDHPNIVKVFNVGRGDGRYYISMEFLDGFDLARVMTRAIQVGSGLGIANAVRMISGVAAGAHYAHTFAEPDGTPLQIVHRDLSPRNLMVTLTGGVKILDFGLAKAANQTHVTSPGKIKGTPSYLSPEQVDGFGPRRSATSSLWASCCLS